MLREALEYIVGLGESKQHEINGSIYSDKELYRVDTYFPKALAIELNTLTGLVDYIKSSIPAGRRLDKRFLNKKKGAEDLLASMKGSFASKNKNEKRSK